MTARPPRRPAFPLATSAVACPTCGAQPGDRCTRRGRRALPHASRESAASDARRELAASAASASDRAREADQPAADHVCKPAYDWSQVNGIKRKKVGWPPPRVKV